MNTQDELTRELLADAWDEGATYAGLPLDALRAGRIEPNPYRSAGK